MSEKKSRRKATVARIRRVRRPAPKKPRKPPSPSEERVLHPNGVLIGYARVSTLDQNLTSQRDALTAAGCTKLFVEQMSECYAGDGIFLPSWVCCPLRASLFHNYSKGYIFIIYKVRILHKNLGAEI
jgi:hypothetical protein